MTCHVSVSSLVLFLFLFLFYGCLTDKAADAAAGNLLLTQALLNEAERSRSVDDSSTSSMQPTEQEAEDVRRNHSRAEADYMATLHH